MHPSRNIYDIRYDGIDVGDPRRNSQIVGNRMAKCGCIFHANTRHVEGVTNATISVYKRHGAKMSIRKEIFHKFMATPLEHICYRFFMLPKEVHNTTSKFDIRNALSEHDWGAMINYP